MDGPAMAMLLTILNYANITILVSSLVEALVLTVRLGWRGYDWKAASVSVADFLFREYPLRWLLPLVFWSDAMSWFWRHRLWTLPMNHWSGWLVCFIGQEFCYYWYHRAAHRTRWFWCTHAVHHSPNQLNLWRPTVLDGRASSPARSPSSCLRPCWACRPASCYSCCRSTCC